MSNTYEITPAQITALSALYRDFQAGITDEGRPPLVGHSRRRSAADLGASGAALAALARKGMAEQDSTLSRLWGLTPTTYRLTPRGLKMARDLSDAGRF